MANPRNNRAPAVTYRVGSIGELHRIPAEGLDSVSLHELKTSLGIEWYDAAGNWTDSPPYPDERGAPEPCGLHLGGIEGECRACGYGQGSEDE